MPDNAFETHGIDHLSASSLNTYAAAPALWIMERLLKKRGATSCAAHRGAATERGVQVGLFDPKKPVKECVDVALKEYDRLSALSGDPNREKERDIIEGCVEQGLLALRPYGVPDLPGEEAQHKVLIQVEGVPVPIIGYKDFHWGAKNITVDLKTSHRLQSDITPAHCRQGAIYVHGTNGEMRFAYVTPKKSVVLRLDDPVSHMDALKHIAKRLEKFLSLSADPLELASLVVPAYDSFYWNDPQTRNFGREVYGF